MPYFKWHGINLSGLTCKGTSFARNPAALQQMLDRKQIALLDYKVTTYFSIFLHITLQQKIAFFDQLFTLIDAGILVPQALVIISDQIDNAHLQNVTYTISNQIHDGQPLSNTLAAHPVVFDAISIQLIKAGEESGNLAQSLNAVCCHLRTMNDFKKKMQAALALPVITFLFFCSIMIFIFLVILPRFAHLFSMMQKELPPFTQRLLSISDFFQSRSALVLLAGIIITLAAAWWYRKQSHIAALCDRFIFYLPFIGSCMRYRFLANFFTSFALLLDGGHKVVPALTIIQATTTNTYLQNILKTMVHQVTNGSSLSSAMSNFEWLFDPDIIAMIHIGQESGKLTSMCSHSAKISHDRLTQKLQSFTLLIQPLLMILLGLCVTTLIIAIYGPICNLADITI
jgi:type IV pilus assembly protein PilC